VTTDAELIVRSLGGNEAAFVEVVRRHARAVSAYLVRRVGRMSAEDLLSEVWLQAFASRASYDRSFADARPWLFGIARNVLRSHWRAAPQDELLAEAAQLPVVLNPWPEVEERLDIDGVLRGGFEDIRRALVALAPGEREVILLVAWEELSVADAARALGIPAGTARYRLHRARLALRAAAGLQETLTQLDEIRETR
jgi:RNA polymerase sigma-70 factor (ECF subfamily)